MKPIFESKQDSEILYLFARKFGFAEQLVKNIAVEGNVPVSEDILREINRGYGSGVWGWSTAYRDSPTVWGTPMRILVMLLLRMAFLLVLLGLANGAMALELPQNRPTTTAPLWSSSFNSSVTFPMDGSRVSCTAPTRRKGC